MAEPSEDDPLPEESLLTGNDHESGARTNEMVGDDDTSSDPGDAAGGSETSSSDSDETESPDGSGLDRGRPSDGSDDSEAQPTSTQRDGAEFEVTAEESSLTETGMPETGDGVTTAVDSIDDAASDAFEETEEPVDTRSTGDTPEGMDVPPGNGEYPAETAPLDDTSPDHDEDVSSLAGRAKPALAERQALVAVAGAMGLGVVAAVVGVLLDFTASDVKVILALGGLLVLVIAVFVLFRAMLSAAERNDEPVKTAVTHPLFMVLFVVLATSAALFIGLLRQLS
jgi:hypothetical protein